MSTYRQIGWVPRASVTALAVSLPEPERAKLKAAVTELLASLNGRGGTMTDEDLTGMLKLEAFGRELGA